MYLIKSLYKPKYFFTLFVLISLTLAACILFFNKSAFAQESQSFDATVSPTFFELTAQPDSSVSQVVRLRNNTSEKIKLNININEMGADETGKLTVKEGKSEITSWVETKNKSVEILPREWTNIPFTLKVPESAAYGYYFALSFTQAGSVAKATTGAKINASIVVPILLNVKKDGAKTEGKLIDFKTDSFFYDYPPVKFTTTFKNLGNVHIKPHGNIFIKDFLGREVAIIEVNNESGIVLPNIKRSFDASWNDSFITYEAKMENGEKVLDKNGKEERELKIRFDKILDTKIGKYTATALFLVSGENRDYTYEATTSFFVFPWLLVIGATLFVIFALVGLFSILKTIIRRVKKIFTHEK